MNNLAVNEIFEIEFIYNGQVYKTTRLSINGSEIFVGFPESCVIISVIKK